MLVEISRIRLIREDVNVWLVYAGLRRRFFDVFQQSNSVFLNIPGFEATEQVFQSDEQIRRHLAMSDQVNRYIRGARSDPPNRSAASYNPYPYKSGSTEAKSFAAELGNIYRMFRDAKAGDLVLSPPVGHYDAFLVGEITNKWRKEDDLEVGLLEGETVPTRKVRWLNTALARRDFPAKVSKRLQNQHAITKLDPIYYEDVFRFVYPSYVWGDTSKLDIYGDNYTSTDPMQPYAAALLVKYVIASVFAYEKGKFAEFQAMPALEALDAYYDEQLIEHFRQNFNSPGKFSVIAALGSLSILASAGLIVANADPASNFDTVKVEAVQQVKGALVGAGKPAAEAALDDYVDSMVAVDMKKVQKELGAPAKKSMSLSLSNRVEVANHKAELDAK